MKITKIFFQIINILFLILYLYPGSILGFVVYNDFSKQPQVTPDFIFISTFLELSHLVIPNRSFQFGDLFGNILGVLISILILKIYNYLEKK